MMPPLALISSTASVAPHRTPSPVIAAGPPIAEAKPMRVGGGPAPPGNAPAGRAPNSRGARGGATFPRGYSPVTRANEGGPRPPRAAPGGGFAGEDRG